MLARLLNRAGTALLLGGAVATAGLLGPCRADDKLERSGPVAAAISREEFARVRQLVKPDPREALWTKVEWVPTLWEAHERAVKEGKPIVVFTVGGEPLGIC